MSSAVAAEKEEMAPQELSRGLSTRVDALSKKLLNNVRNGFLPGGVVASAWRPAWLLREQDDNKHDDSLYFLRHADHSTRSLFVSSRTRGRKLGRLRSHRKTRETRNNSTFERGMWQLWGRNKEERSLEKEN